MSMNRHDKIMALKAIPKNVSKDRINKIFQEYKIDVIKEKKERIKVYLPKGKG